MLAAEITPLNDGKEYKIIQLLQVIESIRNAPLKLMLTEELEVNWASNWPGPERHGWIRYEWITEPVNGKGYVIYTTTDEPHETGYGQLDEASETITRMDARTIVGRVMPVDVSGRTVMSTGVLATHVSYYTLEQLIDAYVPLDELVATARSLASD